MKEYIGLKEIKGSLLIYEDIPNVINDEIVEIRLPNQTKKLGKVIKILGNRAIVQLFQPSSNLSLTNTISKFTGKPMEINLSLEMLGRVFNGLGEPVDDLGKIHSNISRNINGYPINPVSRVYPKNFIQTGFSVIDGLMTLIRGQKLPIFSSNGMPHDKLAAQIVTQSSLCNAEDEKFAIVFASMGLKHDTADYFLQSFKDTGAIERVVTFLNLADDPIMERLITPRIALTTAEYLAYEEGMHILVVLTDMTAYAEALRELSILRNEIPARKGFPGYLYSDFASLYERAGIIKESNGSVTQIPILTMPNNDITHPIPDLSAYITEGQIVMDLELHQKGIYPPVSILPSLSRLMKDGIGAGFTRDDHPDISSQIFSSYAVVEEARALASVIGEDELSKIDKLYIKFGEHFEHNFINQLSFENRTIHETLNKAWEALSILPRSELNRLNSDLISKYYKSGSEV